MDEFTRRRTLGLLAGAGLGGLAGCSGSLGPFDSSRSEPTATADGDDDSPITVRRVAVDRTPAVISTYQTAFSGPQADWAAQTLGAPESATLLVEVECTLPNGQQQEITRLECLVYDESGVEQGRWTRRWETAVEAGVWTLRDQIGVELDPGEYILEPRLQLQQASNEVETIAFGRTEVSVVSPVEYPAEIPWQNLDQDEGSELHVGVPYSVSVPPGDSRVQFADPVVDALATAANQATFDPGRWYLEQLSDTTVDRPSLASGDASVAASAADTADIEVVDHGDGSATVYWANRSVDVDGTAVGTRYDRAFVVVTVGVDAVVTDSGTADYVFSEGPRTETTLVWMPTRVGKRLEQRERTRDEHTLSQHSVRVERAPPPPETTTPTPSERQTPEDTDPETSTPTATPTPIPPPESVDVTAQVQLQLGPLRSRTAGPVAFGEPSEGTIRDVESVYDLTAWQDRPQASRWLTAGIAQQTATVTFPDDDSDGEGAEADDAETVSDADGPEADEREEDGPESDENEDAGPPWRRGNWPTAGFDPTRVGNGSPGVGVPNGVSERWRVRTGDAGETAYRRAVNSSPAIVDGTVYAGSNDGRLYAVDVLTGTVRWTLRTGGQVRSAPTVVDGTLYVGSDDGHLYAVDVGRAATEAGVGIADDDASDPTAYDAADTTAPVLWRAAVGTPVRTAPTVVETTVFVGGTDGRLYALDTETGRERWSVAFEGSETAVTAAATDGDSVYVGSSLGAVHRVDAGGSRGWQVETDGPVRSTPAVADGTLFVGSDDGRVYALDARNGDEQWSTETDGRVVASPALSRTDVFVGSDDGRVYALDRSSGEEVWAVGTGDAVIASPAVVGNTVYAGSRDRRLYAIDAWHGRERWTRRMPGPIVFSSPAVVDGVVAVGSIDGSINGVRSW